MRKKASLLFFLRIIKVFLSILNLTIAANYFGVSFDRDVWLLSLSTILVVDLAIWGPINETFRSKFITMKEEEGEEVALSKLNSLLFFCICVSILITGITIYSSETLAKLVAPGFNAVNSIKLSSMLIYVAPILLLNQLIQIGTSILNAYDIFFIPEIASFGSTLFNIILTILLAPTYGIYALLIAYYFGVFLLFGLILYNIIKINKDIIKNLFTSKPNASFLPFLIFAFPFFIPYFFGQVNVIIEKSLASDIFVGAISTLDYARKFSEMFNSVLSSVLTTMLIPVLAIHYNKKESASFVAEFEKIFRFGFFAIILMVSVFTITPQQFVNIVYPTILPEKSVVIAELVTYYSWGAIAVFLYVISGIALMTHGRSKLYAIFGMIAQIMSIGINLAGYKHFGLFIFPFSFFFAHIICGGIMLCYFPIKNTNLRINLIKLFCVLCFILVFGFVIKHTFSITNNILQIIISFFCSIIALLTALYLLKMEEINFFKKLMYRFK